MIIETGILLHMPHIFGILPILAGAALGALGSTAVASVGVATGALLGASIGSGKYGANKSA